MAYYFSGFRCGVYHGGDIQGRQAMSDENICKCGVGKVSFECVGEDLFIAMMECAKDHSIRSKGIIEYRCEKCGEIITTADSGMMVRTYL